MSHKKKQRPITTIAAYCVYGPHEGKVYLVGTKDEILVIHTPENPFYKMLYYKLIDQYTHLGEKIAIFVRSVKRNEI